MSKHTPGPWFGMIDGCFADTNWTAENDEASVSMSAPITDGKGQTVALVVGECWDDSALEANARLIAQAPALLADLTDAAAQLRKYETLHRAKGHLEKADVNAALAARFEATIAAAVGGAE